MKLAAIICARMESTRLPGKAMLPLCGVPMIQIIYERASQLFGVQDVIIAAPDTEANRVFEKLYPGKVFYGSESNVLSRMIGAAESVGATDIVRLTGDNPIVDNNIHMDVLRNYLGGLEYFTHTGVPAGTQIEIMNVDCLRTIASAISNVTPNLCLLEHPTQGFYYYREHFKTKTVEYKYYARDYRLTIARDYRLTIDEQDDYRLMSIIFNRLGVDVTLKEAIEYLDANPGVAGINAHVRQQNIIGEIPTS